MNLRHCLQIFLLVLMVNEISSKKRHEKSKTRHRGKSRKSSDVTQRSLEILREIKFANQRRVYVDDVVGFACFPDHTDRLVYRFQNHTHVYIAFDSLYSGKLTEMTWRFKPSNKDLLEGRTVSTLNHDRSRSVRKQLQSDVILSASNFNQESRFKEDMDVCESKKTGVSSVYCLIQAFASLAHKMKNVVFEEKCFRNMA